MQKIPRVTFRNDDLETYFMGLEDENVQKVLFEKLVVNISECIKKKRKSCNICYVKDYVVYVPSSDFINILGVLEGYFLKRESFEQCAEIRDLKTLV